MSRHINLQKLIGIRKIKFLGHVDNKDALPNLYACSDYYIMTSKYEGSPSTLLEAMASGLPCIVSDIPHLRMVKDAECGIIVPFGDIENAACQIKDYILEDHFDHSNNARNYAVDMLDWEIIARKYCKVLQIFPKSTQPKQPMDKIT